jgi:hypothetical protein
VNWVKDKIKEQDRFAKGTGSCECSICGQNYNPIDNDAFPCICPDCLVDRIKKMINKNRLSKNTLLYRTNMIN